MWQSNIDLLKGITSDCPLWSRSWQAATWQLLAATGGVHTVLAAKSVSAAIPVVFAMGNDPLRFGLVEALNRPGGNITGVSFFTAVLETKRLGLLSQLVPNASSFGVLMNPTSGNAETQLQDVEHGARALGRPVIIANAVDDNQIETAFDTLVQRRVSALLVAADPFFFGRREKIVALAERYRLPAIYEWREFARAGGLASYGTNLTDAYRLAGVYAGRILKGEKASDLPVVQSTLLGAAAAWPLVARAQQGEKMRRIGVLFGAGADDGDLQARHAAFLQALQQLGWIDSGNVRIDTRFGAGNANNIRRYAAELATLAPDVILATGNVVEQLLQATRAVPIVFVVVPDPVGAGYVDSLSRPGGNVTGFMQFEYSLTAKWLELLKQIAPGVTRAAVLRESALPGIGQFAVIQYVALSVGVEVSPVNLSDAPQIERAIAAYARRPNGGLIVTASALAAVHRDLIVTLAARHKLPAVYSQRHFVSVGGLISYGADFIDQHRRAAGYVDRILKGEKPADLPVQAPTKYELVINLKTAKALGLEVPPTLLALADEVIE
jgi:ABC-type uncharacterized transport system substrate-binding protein